MGNARQQRDSTDDDRRQEVVALEERVAALEERLEQARNAEAVVAVSRMVAHDINNLLSAIMGYASVLKLDLDLEGKAADDLDAIERACLKASGLTGKLTELAEETPLESEAVAARALLDSVESACLEHLPPGARLTVTPPEPESLAVRGDARALQRALLHLCRNGADAISETGRITISAEAITLTATDLMGTPHLTPGPFVRIVVEDDGAGMESATAKQAFKPFFSTKGRDENRGLGLAFVFGLVRRHNGRVALASTPGEGTKITIDLPRADSTSERDAPRDSGAARRRVSAQQ